MKKIFIDAILAGAFISLGGVAFLKAGGIIGAVLFTFGLLSIIHYKLKLYTGVSGFVSTPQDWKELPVVLLGNIVGCGLVGVAMRFSQPDLVDVAAAIVDKRVAAGFWRVLVLAVFCGFIMTTVVNFGRKGQWLPLLFGIPLFIVCGFVHSIADAFYYLLGVEPAGFTAPVLMAYLASVAGNFIGCNAYRIFQRLAV